MINILWNQSLDELSLIIVLLARKKPDTQKTQTHVKRPKSFIVLRQKSDPSDPSFVKNLWHHILISCPPQVPFRVRDGQRYCCSCRCCRRIRRDCTRKPLRLTCNHKICTNRSVWESESIKKVIIGLKREKN